MWRRSVKKVLLLPSRSANFKNPNLVPISCFNHHSIGFFVAPSLFLGFENCLLQFSPFKSAADPCKFWPGKFLIGRRLSTGSASSSESEILGYVPAFPFQKARGIYEDFNHYRRCYWELSKARLSMLVVATSGAGYVLGSEHLLDFVGLCCTCSGTMMVAASANTLNQVFEVENDAKMKRTKQRPLPSGRITVPHAIMWASSMGLAGTTLLAWKIFAG